MSRRTPAVLGCALLFAACEATDSPTEPLNTIDVELRQALVASPYASEIVPIGPMPTQPAAEVALGRALFFDKELSGNRDVACATCHHPSTALGDGLSLSIGTGGAGLGPSRQLGAGREFVPRNAPSLLNVGLGLPYMLWDARVPGLGFVSGVVPPPSSTGTPPPPPELVAATFTSDRLVQQAFLPVLDRTEMRGEPGDVDVRGNPNELAALADSQHAEIWNAVVSRLLAIPEYVSMFAAAFPSTPPEGLGYQHAARALASFQREAFTKPHSAFDRYLEGDDAALTTRQKRGALLFFGEAQCVTCHNGPFLGGRSFDNVGAPQIGPGIGKDLPLDLGVNERVPDEFGAYRFAFRVPPLRNVELTAPYTHSGAYATLEAVVEHYNDVPKSLREYDESQLDPRLQAMHHGDEQTVFDVLGTLAFRVQQPLDLDEGQLADLVAFLRSLTDPAARDLGHLVPGSVPSGLPVGP